MSNIYGIISVFPTYNFALSLLLLIVSSVLPCVLIYSFDGNWLLFAEVIARGWTLAKYSDMIQTYSHGFERNQYSSVTHCMPPVTVSGTIKRALNQTGATTAQTRNDPCFNYGWHMGVFDCRATMIIETLLSSFCRLLKTVPFQQSLLLASCCDYFVVVPPPSKSPSVY